MNFSGSKLSDGSQPAQSTIELNENSTIFHAGTKLVSEDIFATGGRVLNVVVVSNNFSESKKQAITILKDINWTRGFYRKDIGYKVIS